MRIFCTMFLMTIILSCHHQENFAEAPLEVEKIGYNTSDILVPLKLWDKLETVYMEIGNEFGLKIKATNVPKKFFPIKILLIEKNRGVLGGKNYQILLPDGGGTIDLAKYVVGDRGTFYVDFDLGMSNEKVSVFYISHAIEKELSDAVYGAGCNRFYNISSYFRAEMKLNGFAVNTTEARYVHALSGSYVFATREGDTLFLSQVTLKDSRFASLSCL